MLGALFSNAASALHASGHGSTSQHKPTAALESVQEELHTLSLLFPESSQLHHPQDHAYPLPEDSGTPSSSTRVRYDSQGDFDMKTSNIRIIVAQEATALQPRIVLFDSKATSAADEAKSEGGSSRGDHRAQSQASGSQSRRSPQIPSRPLDGGSQGRYADSILPNRAGGAPNGAFERANRRTVNPSVLTDANARPGSNEPTGGVRLILDCMFGSMPLSYRGDSTKLHVFPAEKKAETRSATTSPIAAEGFGSFGRAGGRRRSHLAQSYTPSDLPGFGSLPSSSLPVDGRSPETRTVLITRTFSVNLPVVTGDTEDGQRKSPAPQYSLESTPSFPFPSVDDRLRVPKSKRPRQLRSPMYAIALVLQIPVSTSAPSTPGTRSAVPVRARGTRTSSFSSDKPSQWNIVDPDLAVDSASPGQANTSDIDDRVNVVLERWDVISRVLSSIQTMFKAPMAEMLQQVAATSPQAQASSASSTSAQADSVDDSATPKPSMRVKQAKALPQVAQLLPGALSRSQEVAQRADLMAVRLASALRIPRVVTGQGRWGIWREEARWVGRWGGGKEHKLFFFNLLTAFLGNHTEWLSALSPSWYRQRRLQQHKLNANDDLALTSRTVIISKDKMAARRLVFLLAAFLPAACLPTDDEIPFQATATSASPRGFSQSLPSHSMAREESLRRTLNRRGNSGRSSSVRRSKATPMRDQIPEDLIKGGFGDAQNGEDADSSHLSLEERQLRTANLPILQGSGSRKSSAATTTTVIPANTVAHFSSFQPDGRSGTTAEPRPGSSGSLASLNLMHTLRRSDSTDHSHTSGDSQMHSRWGSLVSGFWSHRRASSTDDSDITMHSEEGPAGKQRPRRTGSTQGSGKLARMVRQAKCPYADGELYEEDLVGDESQSLRASQKAGEAPHSPPKDIGQLQGQAIPPRKKGSEPSFKLSVDENDGIIDVDVPMPGFLSPNIGSVSTSPSTAGAGSLTGLDPTASPRQHAPVCPLSNVESESPINVGGWLEHYHEDFALQAIRPYQGMEEDIKNAMKQEVIPTMQGMGSSSNDGSDDSWIDQCTTLIADTETFSVRRLRLQRRVKPGSHATTSDIEMEEQFTTEPIFDMDGTLIDAVERIIAQSQPPSKPHSPTPSVTGDRPPLMRSISHPEITSEIPRSDCQKMVVGALEQVVRSVAIEREKESDGERGRQASVGGTHATESTLREGVRKWLREVEYMSA